MNNRVKVKAGNSMKKPMRYKRRICLDSKGFTLVELILVIVLLGILQLVAAPVIGNALRNTETASDHNLLIALKSATKSYALYESVPEGDLFEGITSDQDRMEELVATGYLNEPVELRQKNKSLSWNVAEQEWEIVIN